MKLVSVVSRTESFFFMHEYVDLLDRLNRFIEPVKFLMVIVA